MRTAFWATAAAAAVVLLVLVGLGWRPVVLLSDSMAPGAPSGSLLVTRPVAPGVVQPGDVVTVPTGGGGRVTHRVVAVEELDGEWWARLQGDANATPDPGRVRLPDATLRTVAVVPGVGGVLTGQGRLVLVGLGLLALGGASLAALRATGPAAPTADEPSSTPPREPSSTPSREPSSTPPREQSSTDPRVLVLAATLEALGEDGMAPAHLMALARVRTAALLGLGEVEDEVAMDDDGARFVIVALADADPAALRLVGPRDARAVTAHAAVASWWAGLEDDVPPSVRAVLDPVLADVRAQAGIPAASAVD